MNVTDVAGVVAGPPPPGDKSAAAAEDFEALLLGEMFKSMRRTVQHPGGQSFGGSTFDSMLDEQLARTLAHTDCLGIARLIGDGLAPSQKSSQVPCGAVDARPDRGGSA